MRIVLASTVLILFCCTAFVYASKKEQNSIFDKPNKDGKSIEMLFSELENSEPVILDINVEYYGAEAPEVFEYVCPKDKSKSVYKQEENKNEYKEAKNTGLYYAIVKLINKNLPKGMKMSVDDTLFCKKHFPEAEERYSFLIVKYKGNTVKNKIGRTDIAMLFDFFSGGKTYLKDDKMYSLKDEIPRIKELLGYQGGGPDGKF